MHNKKIHTFGMRAYKMKETLDSYIKTTWHSIFRMYNQVAAEFDLTQAVGFALLNIDDKTGTLSTQIAPLMGMEASSSTRLLKNMETSGLISKESDDSDGRKVIIKLTEEGLKKRRIAKKVVKEFNLKLSDSISEEESKTFVNVISKINELAEQYKLEKSRI